jgi:integrase
MNKSICENNNYIQHTIQYHPFDVFIARYNNNNTKEGYMSAILDFFSTISNNKFTYLTDINKSLILGVNSLTILEYYNYLNKNGYAKTTMKYKFAIIKELYKFLITLKIYNENNPVDILDRKIKVKDDDVAGSDIFTIEEIKLLIDNADKKHSTLYKLAVLTGVRVSALLNLTIDSFKIHKDGNITVTGLDKGDKRFTNIITRDVYDNCIELYKKNYKDNKIFNMTRQNAASQLKTLIKKLEIETEDRKLSFHSFKKSAITIAGDLSNGDIRKMLEVSHHSNPELTLKIYDKSKQNLNNNIGHKIANLFD